MQPLQSDPGSPYILPIRGDCVVGMQRRTWYAGLVTVSFPKVAPPGAADDLAKATDIARSMVTRFGMDENLGSVSFEAEHAALGSPGAVPYPPFQSASPAKRSPNPMRTRSGFWSSTLLLRRLRP